MAEFNESCFTKVKEVFLAQVTKRRFVTTQEILLASRSCTSNVKERWSEMKNSSYPFPLHHSLAFGFRITGG